MTISKEQATELSSKSQMRIIFDEIEMAAKGGAKSVNLYEWLLGPGGGYVSTFDFKVTALHAQILKESGFEIKEEWDIIKYGWLWNRKQITNTWYTVRWS